jgi:hypothetical protein
MIRESTSCIINSKLRIGRIREFNVLLLVVEKVEVKIRRKSISYLKENPTDRTFKALVSCLEFFVTRVNLLVSTCYLW